MAAPKAAAAEGPIPPLFFNTNVNPGPLDGTVGAKGCSEDDA
jgi:hypothetical protein